MGRTAVFLLGAGGSGKSTVRLRLWPGLPAVDPDDFLPDQTRPTEGRDVAKAGAERRRLELLAEGASFVSDTTGTNSARVAREMADAETAGYTVVLCYVRCALTICQARNAHRGAKPGGRFVPPDVITADWQAAQAAWAVLAPPADVAWVEKT